MKKIAISLLIIGIILGLIGVGNGAHWGLYADGSGFHVMPKNTSEVTQDFDSFSGIDVTLHNGNVVIEQGDGFSVTSRYLFNAPEISVEGGVLTITPNDFNEWFNIGFWWPNEVTTITIPADAIFNNVKVYNDNGSIKVSDLNVQNSMDISNHNGSVYLANISANGGVHASNENGSIKLDTIKSASSIMVKNQNGSVTLSNGEAMQIAISNENGGITINGALGRIDVTNHNGGIIANLAGMGTDFYINAKTENGSVSLNGKRMGNSLNQGDPNNANSFSATNENGWIRMGDL